jgi:hypothetical protein
MGPRCRRNAVRSTGGSYLNALAKLAEAKRRRGIPLAKDVDDFKFADTPVNETLVRDLAGGN